MIFFSLSLRSLKLEKTSIPRGDVHGLSYRKCPMVSVISADLAEASQPPVVVGVATGAFLFLANLVRHFKFPMSFDFIRVESSGCGCL